jgi:ankyrin repeat protein
MSRRVLVAAAFALAVWTGPAALAQTPPSAMELGAYRGLHAAAAAGDVAGIRRLAAGGERLDGRDGNGRTPLHVAAFRGQAQATRALIAAGADPDLLDDQRYDALTIAAVRDDLPTVKALLASGASAKLITSRYDGTALIAAAHLGHDGVVEALARAGAPLDHVNNLGWTALMEAVVLGDGGSRHVETVRILLAAGADRGIADRQGATPLRQAEARGYRAMAELLK